MPYFHAIDPVALQLGPLAIHWYGLMYVLGFFFTWWLGKRRLAQGRLAATPEQFSDLLFYGMLGVILGGRLGYVFFYGFKDLLADPVMILRVWEGGMSFHGGLLGVLLAMAWWSRRHALHFFDTMDFVAPLVPIGLGLGRLGNFIGGELWGRHTDVSWGVIFPRALQHIEKSSVELQALYAQGALNAEARHPSQLYEMVLEGIVLFIVLWIYSMKPRPRYAVSGVFALLYGVFRIAVELLREPDKHLGFLAFDWLTMGQVLSLPLVAVGVGLLILSTRQGRA